MSESHLGGTRSCCMQCQWFSHTQTRLIQLLQHAISCFTVTDATVASAHPAHTRHYRPPPRELAAPFGPGDGCRAAASGPNGGNNTRVALVELAAATAPS